MQHRVWLAWRRTRWPLTNACGGGNCDGDGVLVRVHPRLQEAVGLEVALCGVLGRQPGPGDDAGRRKLHLRFSLGTGLDAGVVVVPESGSTSAVSRLVE